MNEDFQVILRQAMPDDTHEWLLPTSLVASGYGVSESSIRSQKSRHSDELLEGIHWIKIPVNNGLFKIMWTRRGVIRLGLFIESTRGRMFRDYVETLVLSHWHKTNTPPAETLEPGAIVKSSSGQVVPETHAPQSLRRLATPHYSKLSSISNSSNVVKAELVDDEVDADEWGFSDDIPEQLGNKKTAKRPQPHVHLHEHRHEYQGSGLLEAFIGLIIAILLSFAAYALLASVASIHLQTLPAREVTK
jgi:hypothetical protein